MGFVGKGVANTRFREAVGWLEGTGQIGSFMSEVWQAMNYLFEQAVLLGLQHLLGKESEDEF